MNQIQYTLRNIPQPLDQVLRKRAKQSGKSFNQTVIEALNREVFGTAQAQPRDTFGELYGAGEHTLDAAFDDAIADQSKIDPEQWQ